MVRFDVDLRPGASAASLRRQARRLLGVASMPVTTGGTASTVDRRIGQRSHRDEGLAERPSAIARRTPTAAAGRSKKAIFRYARPTPGPAGGMRMATMTSSGSRLVMSGPMIELVDAEASSPVWTCQLDLSAAGQQERGRVGVWLREGEVAAERAGVADAHVGDVDGAGGAAPARAPGRGRTLDLPMRRPRRRCAASRPSVVLDGTQLVDALEVDERGELGKAGLHDLEQLGAAGVVGAFVVAGGVGAQGSLDRAPVAPGRSGGSCELRGHREVTAVAPCRTPGLR